MVIPVVDPPPGLTSAELKTYWIGEARRVAQAAADLTRKTVRPPRAPIPPMPTIPEPITADPTNDWPPDPEPEPEDERPWFADDGQWITLDVDRETSDAA